VSNLPLSGGGTTTFRVSGSPERSPSERAEAVMRAVAADYFEAMRIRLIEGRQFTPRDDATAGRVILINASLARQLFPTGHALGSRFRFAAFPDRDWEVIGVVADVKTARLDADAPPTIYYSQLQAPENRLSLAIRVACPTTSITGPGNAESCVPNAVIGAVRRAVATSDPSVSVYAAGTMEQQVTDSPAVFARRYPLLLIGLFAATALVLSVVGLYGVISYAVAQRTREFGIRLALGSSDGGIRGLVLQRGAVVASTGVAIGVPVAFGAARLMRGMLYGVDASDPLTYVVACVVLAAVALLASWIPARRATRIQPTVALRSDE
jgi:predicted permease